MNRFAFYLLVAVLSLISGLQFNELVARLAEIIIDDAVVVTGLPETNENALVAFPEAAAIVVICLSDKREVYIDKRFAGTPDDTRLLEELIARRYADYYRSLTVQPLDLNQKIRITHQPGTAYVKAFIGSSFADVMKLIAAAKRSGADSIGLIADRRKPVHTY